MCSLIYCKTSYFLNYMIFVLKYFMYSWVMKCLCVSCQTCGALKRLNASCFNLRGNHMTSDDGGDDVTCLFSGGCVTHLLVPRGTLRYITEFVILRNVFILRLWSSYYNNHKHGPIKIILIYLQQHNFIYTSGRDRPRVQSADEELSQHLIYVCKL